MSRDYRRQEGPHGQIRLPRPGDPDPFPNTRFRRNTTVTPVEPMAAYWEASQRRMDLFSYQRSDAWALITAHVNTAAPPPVFPSGQPVAPTPAHGGDRIRPVGYVSNRHRRSSRRTSTRA